jgi:hypothetical protein
MTLKIIEEVYTSTVQLTTTSLIIAFNSIMLVLI